jgi:hypothetical protein
MKRLALLCTSFVLACSARSSLETAGGSAGTGASSSNGSSSPSSSSSTGAGGSGGQQSDCAALALDGEPYLVPFAKNSTAPELGFANDSELFLAWRAEDGALIANTTLTPSSVWPDPFDSSIVLEPSVSALVVGPSSNGTAGLYRDGFDQFWFTSRMVTFDFIDLYTTPTEPLFVAANEDVIFFSRNDGLFLTTESYGPSGLISYGPPFCIASKVLASAIPLPGKQFLIASVDSADAGQSCFGQGFELGTNLVTRRYAELQDGELVEQFPQVEPLLHLGLVPTSFGSWLVYQTDGSTSETMPPVFAYRLDNAGVRLPSSAEPLALTESGLFSSELALATMGDALVIATVDSTDPSAPVVILRRFEADGSPGPVTSFATNAAWLGGHLRMVGSKDGQSLLLAWSADLDASVAVAKVACSP